MKVNCHHIGLSQPSELSPRRIGTIVRAVFDSEKKRPSGEVNVIFVDAKTIRRLNQDFLDHAGDTDVIAFPYDEGPRRSADRPWGDIYISVPEARQNARRFKESISRELTRLVVHGLLHLLGYRDDSSAEKSVMWAKQEKIVDEFHPAR